MNIKLADFEVSSVLGWQVEDAVPRIAGAFFVLLRIARAAKAMQEANWDFRSPAFDILLKALQEVEQ